MSLLRGSRSIVVALLALLAAGPAAAQSETCVTACQAKTDACARQCEALGRQAYDAPGSLRECQLSCARGLFVGCVERCSRTGEVAEDDYVVVAPDPDHVPPDAKPVGEPAQAKPPSESGER